MHKLVQVAIFTVQYGSARVGAHPYCAVILVKRAHVDTPSVTIPKMIQSWGVIRTPPFPLSKDWGNICFNFLRCTDWTGWSPHSIPARLIPPPPRYLPYVAGKTSFTVSF